MTRISTSEKVALAVALGLFTSIATAQPPPLPLPPAQVTNWTNWFSEEWPRHVGVCNIESAVSGINASGPYSDNLQLACKSFGAAPWHLDHASSRWLSFFSEEPYNARWCMAGEVVTGVQASGSFSDNLALQCTPLKDSMDRLTRIEGCHWLGPVSDETGPRTALNAEWALGARCTGSYCDNVDLYVCTVLPPSEY